MKWLIRLSGVAAHKGGCREAVTADGRVDLLAGGAGGQVENGVQRGEAEEVAVRAGRRARAGVADGAEVVGALGAGGCEDSLGIWADVPDEPVGEGARRGVGVVDDEDHRTGAARDAGDCEGGRRVFTLTGEAGGDRGAVGEVGAGEMEAAGGESRKREQEQREKRISEDAHDSERGIGWMLIMARRSNGSELESDEK